MIHNRNIQSGRVYIGGNNYGSVNTTNVFGGQVFDGDVVMINGRVVQGNQVLGGSNQVVGNGEAGQEERAVPSFDRIKASNFQVKVQAGQAEPGLRLSGDSNLIPYVETKVVDGTLHIGAKPNTSFQANLPMIISVAAGDLTGISASLSAAVEANGIVAQRFRASADTSATLTATGTVDHLRADAENSGTLELAGLKARVAQVDASTSGTATIQADEANVEASTSGQATVHAKVANVEASTSGEAIIHGAKELNAEASTSGGITYTGNPRLSEETSTGGWITRG